MPKRGNREEGEYLLPEELSALLPGQLVVQGVRSLIFIALICRREGSGVSVALDGSGGNTFIEPCSVTDNHVINMLWQKMMTTYVSCY